MQLARLAHAMRSPLSSASLPHQPHLRPLMSNDVGQDAPSPITNTRPQTPLLNSPIPRRPPKFPTSRAPDAIESRHAILQPTPAAKPVQCRKSHYPTASPTTRATVSVASPAAAGRGEAAGGTGSPVGKSITAGQLRARGARFRSAQEIGLSRKTNRVIWGAEAKPIYLPIAGSRPPAAARYLPKCSRVAGPGSVPGLAVGVGGFPQPNVSGLPAVSRSVHAPALMTVLGRGERVPWEGVVCGWGGARLNR